MNLVSKDDVFLLGNLGMMAVMTGHGEEALPILEFMQEIRPHNAGGFIGEALYHYSKGDTDTAMAMMEETIAMDSEVNRDEALAFHLFILFHSGNVEDANQLSHAYLDAQLITEPQARTMIEEIRKLSNEILDYEEYTEAEQQQEVGAVR